MGLQETGREIHVYLHVNIEWCCTAKRVWLSQLQVCQVVMPVIDILCDAMSNEITTSSLVFPSK